MLRPVVGVRGATGFGAIGILAVVAVTGANAAHRAYEPACQARSLTGTFTAIPGSPGAGSISYRLRLRNGSTRACFVTGLPRLLLLDKAGKPLPTHVTPLRRGALTAPRIVLAPGAYASASARFSPDVPGEGEPIAGAQCERTAYGLRIWANGGGALVAPVRPPTPVCEHGAMVVSVLVAGRNAQ